MNLRFSPQTVIMMVGPTGCGKSYFSQILKNKLSNCVYINSDTIRTRYIGIEDKYDIRMKYASQAAFDTLFFELENAMKYPVIADYIIVDTTALSDYFRKRVSKMASAYKYRLSTIVFNYDDVNEYVKYNTCKIDIIHEAVKRFKKEIASKEFAGYRDVQTITSKKFEEVVIETTGPGITVPDNENYLVVPDVHGCFTALEELMALVPEPYSLILNGDWIDKGPDTFKILDYILDGHTRKVYPIIGNHENFVYKYLKGMIKDAPEIPFDCFDSIEKFKSSPEYTEKFFNIIEHATAPFLKGVNFIATHAPCSVEYLGRLDSISLRNQRNFRYTHLTHGFDIKTATSNVNKALSFLAEDASFSHPFHVFGHVPTPDGIKLKNKLGVDLGCSSGGRLAGVFFEHEKAMDWKYRPKTYQVCGFNHKDGELLNLHPCKEVNDEQLTEGPRNI